MAIVVSEVAHDPDTGVVHFYDGGDALGGAEPEDRHGNGLGERVAVHGNDGEGVAGKREAANLGGAAVEDVEEDALALFDADGLAVAEHASVDGEGIVADFEAVGMPLASEAFIVALALESLSACTTVARREEVLSHVAATTEAWAEILSG